MTGRIQVNAFLLLLSLLLSGLAGCARQSTPPAVPPTPTLIPGWERYTHPEPCSYVIDHPSIMDIAPTVLRYFGLTVPADIDGKALFQ